MGGPISRLMEQQRKRISLITPFHNIDPAVFQKTAASVSRTAEKDWEWIVILHNTDQITEKELRALVGRDDLLRVYEKKDDRHTPSAPRNLGLQMASGEFIYFLDGDDCLEPGFISETARRMERDEADIGIGRVRVKQNGSQIMRVPLPLLFPYQENGYTVGQDPEERGNLLYGAPMMLGSKLIRRDLIWKNGIRFDEEITLTEDVIFMLECCIHAEKIRIYKDLTAYTYIQSEGSLLQRMIFRDDAGAELYLTPLRRIVSLCLANHFSPGAYLWNMFALFGSLNANPEIEEGKRKRLMTEIQKYLPLLSRKPPEGIGNDPNKDLAAEKTEELLEKKLENSQEETFARYFLRHVFLTPDQLAVQWRDAAGGEIRALSYRTLAETTAGIASALTGQGLAGKPVALAGSKSIQWFLICVTCLTWGFPVVPLDENLEKTELAARVRTSGAGVLFTDQKCRLEELCPDGVAEMSLDETENLAARGKKLLDDESVFASAAAGCLETDRALLLFTSGTEGGTKCAVLCQRTLPPEKYLWLGIEMDKYTCLSLLPFSHVAGFKDIVGALITGTCIFLSTGLKNFFRDFLYVQPVSVTMVPIQAKFIASVLEGKTASDVANVLGGNIRMLRLVGAPVGPETKNKFEDLGIRIHSNYGLTEACGTVSCSFMEAGEISSRPGSSGRVIPGVEVKIDHPDDFGNGEILLKGPIVFDGYLNAPAETEAAFRDGWLCTGDLGHVDPDRSLYLIGRAKNVIVLSGGEKIIPEELENRISALPYVRECIVYGEEDTVAAHIVLEPGGDMDQRRAAAEQAFSLLRSSLPYIQRPQKVTFAYEPLPRTDSGKIKRAAWRK